MMQSSFLSTAIKRPSGETASAPSRAATGLPGYPKCSVSAAVRYRSSEQAPSGWRNLRSVEAGESDGNFECAAAQGPWAASESVK
jgi:hypothetical protein